MIAGESSRIDLVAPAEERWRRDSGALRRWTRRRFLVAAGSGIAALSLSGLTAAGKLGSSGRSLTRSFVSRPDLSPPTVSVVVPARGTAPGYIFLGCVSGPGQQGPMIVDDEGELVWFQPLANATALNLRVQRFHGRPVLTWWQGVVRNGYGIGYYVLADETYAEIHRVRAGDGLSSDLHDFLVTPESTALVTAYRTVRADLSSLGGPRNGTLVESFVQEVEIGSGRVLLDWRARDHVRLAETYATVANGTLDPFHVNSVDVTADGNLLVSARHTCALYKIERRSGRVIWRLGGKRSDFELGHGARFYWQHDAQHQPDGSITVFDDGAGLVENEPASRGIRLVLDERVGTAMLVDQYVEPQQLLAHAMGSMQRLADGGAFVGWGTVPSFSEFTPAGELRFDARLPPHAASYRAYRDVWAGSPRTRPALVVDSFGGARAAFASWNGATGVTHWRLNAGGRPATLRPREVVPRRGFETAIPLPPGGDYVSVDALDGRGGVLATSKAVEV
jgi:hypothetical protein